LTGWMEKMTPLNFIEGDRVGEERETWPNRR
jgi:hypothetical protein